MTEARGRRSTRGRSRQNKHSNVRQMMVGSSTSAQSSRASPAPASTSASVSASSSSLNSQSRTTSQRFTQLRTLSQPGTRSRKSEVLVPYVPLAHTPMPLPASTDRSEVGNNVMDLGDDCEMIFDGIFDGAEDPFAAGDKEEGEMDESGSEEESDPQTQTEKERLADVRTLHFLFMHQHSHYYMQTYEPNAEWNTHRCEILDEFCRLEGRGDHGRAASCAGGCDGEKDVIYRCHDCYDMQLYCASCMIGTHRRTPFHKIEVGTMFLGSAI
jgi:hypothetical protein